MLAIAPPGSLRTLVIADQVRGYRALGDTSATLSAAQTFLAPSASIQGIVVALSRAGSPAHDVTATIRRTLTGPDLASVRLSGGAFSTDYRNPTSVAATFPTPAAVIPGEPYLLVLSVSAANSAHYYRWSVDTRDPYPAGMVQVGTKLYHFQDALARIIYRQP